MEYQKYRKKSGDNKFVGFPTVTKRVEIYSQIFKDHGYDPLPFYQEPPALRSGPQDVTGRYPLTLTGAKLLQYCHSQHRALPSLRRVVPDPFLEINPAKAAEIWCRDGDWVIVESPHGAITLKARLSEKIAYDVVCTQNGWWQACEELNLPAYDPYSREGANVNMLFMTDRIDPISGSLPLKGHPCRIRRKE